MQVQQHHPRTASSVAAVVVISHDSLQERPPSVHNPTESPLRRSPRGHYKPEHNDFVFMCLNAAIEGSKVIEIQLKKQEADLAEVAETLASARSALVGYVTAPIHDPYFDLSVEGVKQTLLRITNQLHGAAEAGGTMTMEALVNLLREDFLLKQRIDQFQALWKEKMEAGGIEDIQGRLWWTSHWGPLSFVPWTTFVQQIRSSQSDFPADEASVQHICDYLDFTQDGFVSIYEFNLFLNWFGPLHGCWQRILDPVKEGIIMGFMPALEANQLLLKQRPGTYLVRFSKTKPSAFAVTFLEAGQPKHSLLYHVSPVGLSVKSGNRNPSDIYRNLREFVGAHSAKLKMPLGKELQAPPPPHREILKPDTACIVSTSPAAHTPLSGSAGGPEEDHMGPNEAQQLCVICMDRPVGAVFLECGHLACCVTCSAPLRLCPICRGTITRTVQIFRP